MSKQSFGQRISAAWWPQITDIGTARKAAMNGFWIASCCAIATGASSCFGWFGVSKNGIWDAIIFAVIAVGVSRMSRIAAIAGLLLYLFERVYTWTQPGAQHYYVMAIPCALMFINGVRGTLKYHQLRKQDSSALAGQATA